MFQHETMFCVAYANASFTIEYKYVGRSMYRVRTWQHGRLINEEIIEHASVMARKRVARETMVRC